MMANAQGAGWLQDRARAQGPGFRLGNLELHPGLGVEAGYDTNLFYEDNDGPTEPVGSAIFRITPHLFISTLTQQRQSEGEGQQDEAQARMIQFSAGVSGEVYIFLADEGRNNVALNGDLDLNINPKGRFGFRLFDNLSRTVRPFTGRPNADALINNGLVNNTAGVQLFGRSRGGALQSSLGYAFRLQYFEAPELRYANQFGHQISADTHFRFLPSTSLFWDGNLELTDYYNNPTGEAVSLANNWRLRTRVGINGAVTPKLSLTLAVGYGATFVQDAAFSDFESVIAHASMKYRFTPTTSLGLGFERENVGSIVGLSRVQNRGFLTFQWLLARSFLFGINASVAYVDFGQVLDGMGVSLGERTDVMVSASLFGEYRFTDYLALNLSLSYLGDYTDFEYPAAGSPAPDPAGFNKFEAWLGLRVFY